jgi:hypothetical protein
VTARTRARILWARLYWWIKGSPKFAPVPGLMCWLEPGDAIRDERGVIVFWPDRTGHGNHLFRT